MKTGKVVMQMKTHAFLERSLLSMKGRKPTGRYSLLSTGNVPAFSIMKRSVK